MSASDQKAGENENIIIIIWFLGGEGEEHLTIRSMVHMGFAASGWVDTQLSIASP